MIRPAVYRIVANAKAVAREAATMSIGDAGEIVTMVDEPELLVDPGEAPPRYTWAAIQAARLLMFDDCATMRDGQPRSFAR